MDAVLDVSLGRPSPVPGIPGATFEETDDVPLTLAGAEPAGPFTQAERGRLLIAIAGIGRFLASGGDRIRYAPETLADPGAVQMILHGSARAALIHQRGELPLHAATVLAPQSGAAIALCGDRGAGKSTLAAELVGRGWQLVADDTTRLTWDGTSVQAWPSCNRIKLRRDACERLGWNTASLEPVTRAAEKFYVPTQMREDPVPLTSIVALDASAGGPAGKTVATRVAAIARHTFRPGYLRPLRCEAANFALAAKIAGRCGYLQVSASPRLAVSELADAVEHTFR